MADSLQYPSASHYVPATYFAQPHAPGHMHIVSAPPRQDSAAQRKRPKYTRSKTGCLTCRAKKIKCDESKPNCMRCTHGQRECTWPEGVPARKKPTPRREPAPDNGDARPSTAGSSGLSDTSTPPTRDHTPPSRRDSVELGLPPLVTRRNSESVLHMPPGGDANGARRQSLAPGPSSSAHGYPMHPSSHTQLLPAIPEMSSSYSAHQYQHAYPPSHNYGSSHSLSLSRHDNGHHLRQAESSSGHGQWSASPMLTTPVDPLEPFFPTVQERNLIRHYCDNSMSIIMAFPSENPILAANLQFVLSRLRGSDSAVESLRTALLGIAAVHQSFLLSRSGACHGRGGADEVMQLANSFRAKSKRLLSISCATSEGAGSDAALGAAIAIALIDIFSGGHGWFKTLQLAKLMVNMRGGPAVLLARSSHTKGGSVTGVSRARLLLEILAVYEIFGCIACDQEPTLLSPHASGWWLDQANSNDSQSYVEKVFGMSRELILVLARATCLLARASLQNQTNIQEIDAETGSPTDSDNTADARALYAELETWSHRSDDLPDRVRAGNCIYQRATQIMLLRDVLKLPPDDTLVQQHAENVLALCLDCGENRMGVDLNWPVIIAGSQMYGADRTRVLAIFEAFRTQCCYEIETSEHIVLQVWRRLDEKQPRADWRSVMQDLDLNVLIL